ncbi:MAG TPA: DNA-deoxyinosine glycosylase [Lachnospiraceae bacterium]|nr:DNA-deoxyinosine glycosylase [Lachnospiraceae bacterium]
MYERFEHTASPVYDENSSALILGTFPSVKSREGRFFYHHPQNRFWKVLAHVFESEIPRSIEEKKALLLNNHVALWDVIESCEVEGSSDSSIRNVVPNRLSLILDHSPIGAIYANGNKAYELYMKFCYPETKRDIIKLPSTSPANAGYSLDKLIECWRIIRKDI